MEDNEKSKEDAEWKAEVRKCIQEIKEAVS